MKLQLSGTAVLSLILLAAAVAPGQQPAAGNPKAPQGSGKSLVTTAGIPEEHLGLVRYFQDLAWQEQALAKSYDRIAKMYEEKKLPSGLDPASAREMKYQYRRLAETERKAAEAALRVAAYHSRLAALMTHLSVAAEQAEAVSRSNPQDSAFRR